ncbi:MAG: nuclear transport factor 2 family protein [Ferruginibacter sp.]|nr:nuclear transport factor 2 family protein [Ferruginibacter sp.]
MNNDEKLIEKFYTSFQNLNSEGMNACYSNDIVFFDPMFDILKGDEAKAMWQMLCKSAKAFSLEFDSIKNLEDGYYNCNWKATYNFSKTGKTVINNGKAYMKIENGLITEHSDGWSFHKWSSQAIGIMGKLFGWAGFFKQKVKNNAKKTLLDYIQKSYNISN